MSPDPFWGRALQQRQRLRESVSTRQSQVGNERRSLFSGAECAHRLRRHPPSGPPGTCAPRQRTSLCRREFPLTIGPNLFCHDAKRRRFAKVPGNWRITLKNSLLGHPCGRDRDGRGIFSCLPAGPATRRHRPGHGPMTEQRRLGRPVGLTGLFRSRSEQKFIARGFGRGYWLPRLVESRSRVKPSANKEPPNLR